MNVSAKQYDWIRWTMETAVRCTLRDVRIPADQADEFTRLPPSGDVVHGFTAAAYPTEQPHFPDRKDPS
ncbi:hypothetical protein C8P63_12248 [Melghirimyces profundicolus]|uniref:Uncharacterized protein n=1 Tax=Melghirimyces profundicolus TaxID=1242148 RepID=A0A2T6BG94_9BACL|nr:hypothetical protein [Melghirimyces profundicolus]PTX55088.1 hypothetical protein C8P63_12248 [Melghirimyces profundicolus]